MAASCSSVARDPPSGSSGRVTPNSFWQVNISSITGGGQCNEVDVISRSLTFADDFSLPVAWIGSTLNDNVGRIQVYHL